MSEKAKAPAASAAEQAAASEAGADASAEKKGIDWTDPSVPAGNAPPMPNWPVALAVLTWAGWITFLAAMWLTA
jgi:hypothetical protein